MSTTPAPSALPRYITTVVGGESYGVAVAKIRDILRPQKPQPVDGGPAYLRGVLDVRGRSVPVVDLRTRFDLPATFDVRTCILVVELDAGGRPPFSVGLIVDTIAEVFCLGHCDPLVCPVLPAAIHGVVGECRIKGRARRLLDVDRLFPADIVSLLAGLARPVET